MAVTGQIDAEGRLISADAPLLDLHLGAGGLVGGTVAIPQIATLARLARTLGILVSRPVLVADGSRTLELFARARLENDVVHMAISDWHDAAVVIDSPPIDGRTHDFARLEADGAWETDAQLRLARLSAGIDGEIGGALRVLVGLPLSAAFALQPAFDGNLPLLLGLANRAPFVDQRAVLQVSDPFEINLSGEPWFTADGGFAGLRGSFRRAGLGAPSEFIGQIKPEVAAAGSEEFTERLDGALRNPIGKIIAHADAISAQNDGPLRHDYVDYASDISSAGRHLLGLVDDLVDLQAIERPDFHIDFEEVDLADVSRRAAGLLSVRAADRDVRIDRPDIDDDLPARGEFRRVLQIMVNLVGNAVRYSPPGSMIWIRTEAEGDLAAVVVADQGKGIALSDQARIFEKFERVDPSEPGGSGLGLYIARRLARAMGGDITVDSAPGQGARFVLTLPMARV
jgi:signal transduction histidine kinase